ncbi:MAG: GlsB/YeaQ/YmgE family stress response membrane protein [Nitriliruptorales bacterium]
MITGIIGWLIVGAIVGYIARLLMPGRDPMGCLATSALGVVGSLVGGTLANLLFDGEVELSPAGFIGSVIGAMIVLLVIRRTRRPPRARM